MSYRYLRPSWYTWLVESGKTCGLCPDCIRDHGSNVQTKFYPLSNVRIVLETLQEMSKCIRGPLGYVQSDSEIVLVHRTNRLCRISPQGLNSIRHLLFYKNSGIVPVLKQNFTGETTTKLLLTRRGSFSDRSLINYFYSIRTHAKITSVFKSNKKNNSLTLFS